MKMRAWLAFALAFLTGCVERAPVSEKDANIYQKAVFYNSDRPYSDRKRDKERKPAEILEFAGVKPGDKVIDLLGGGGWYTEILSDVVGDEGHVYLVNTPLFLHIAQQDMEERLQGKRFNNVTRVDSPWGDLNLPTDIDVIWIALSFHDIYVKRPPKNKDWEADPEHFFEQLRKSLKPGGLLLITDHAARAESKLEDIKLHRIDEQFVIDELQREGFTLLRKSQALRNQNDQYELDIWKKQVRRNTDRFVHLYQKK